MLDKSLTHHLSKRQLLSKYLHSLNLPATSHRLLSSRINSSLGKSRNESQPEACHATLQDTLEILHFLMPARQHIKEGLIPDCSKAMLGGGQAFEDLGFSLPSSQGLNNQSLHLSTQVVKALIGEPLSEEDLLKVGHSLLLAAHSSCALDRRCRLWLPDLWLQPPRG